MSGPTGSVKSHLRWGTVKQNLHTAHFSLVVVAPLIADRQLPHWSLSCTIGVRQRCGGVEVDTPS